MTKEDHIKRHKKLHKCLDELAADYLDQTGRLLHAITVMELISRSYRQTVQPTNKRLVKSRH